MSRRSAICTCPLADQSLANTVAANVFTRSILSVTGRLTRLHLSRVLSTAGCFRLMKLGLSGVGSVCKGGGLSQAAPPSRLGGSDM